ncbi:hypothetical protein KRP22_012117 [Phytophthora ramorum]|nr:Pre-mRNA polyadenylation factor fip1 [Phytophthora ramorum]
MEDEDFGEDVLVTTQRVGGGVKEEAKTEESRATWEVETVKKEAEKVEEDEDEELYGGVSIQLNASATSQAEAAAASAAAGNGVKTSADPAADSEDDEDDEDVAIVLSTAHAGGKPTLRFTGGGNRFVRGSFGGPQHGATGATGAGAAPGSHQPGEHGDSTGDGVDDMAMFGGRRTAFDVDIDLLEDRPWRKPGVDISDYFNYGFDEHTWREYAARQLRLRRDLAMEKSREQASRQAVNAANQQAMRERDAKMQGRGFPGQIKPEGTNRMELAWVLRLAEVQVDLWGHPRVAGTLGWARPQASWVSRTGMAPRWAAHPGGLDQDEGLLGWVVQVVAGAGGGRGGFDERGRGGKDDRDDRRHDLGSAKVAAELQ